MNIYVVHHNELKERKKYLSDILKFNNVKVDWIEKYHPKDIKVQYDEIISNFIQNDKDELIIHPYGQYKNVYKKISINEFSLYLKHKYVLEQEKDKNSIVLILEDDIEIVTNFKEFLNENLNEFENSEYDILMMGTAFNFRSKNIKPGKYIHFEPNQKTRCTHAIMYKPNCIPIILKELEKVNYPIDFKLNEIIQKHKLKVAWSEPGLNQKKYKSSLR